MAADKLLQSGVSKCLSVVILNQNTSLSAHDFIPRSLKEVKISEICRETRFDESFCKGKIKLVGPNIPKQKTQSKKIVIGELKDTNSSATETLHQEISVFLTGDSVSQCSSLKSDDVVYITGCKVDLAPSKPNKHPHDLLLDFSKQTARIWIIPSKQLGPVFENSFAISSRKRTQDQTNSSVPSTSKSTTVAAKRTKLDESAKPTDPEYKYCKLVDLKADTKPNIYGVVKFFKDPFLTRTGEFCCSMILADPTCNQKDALKCVLFAKDVHSLPSIHSVGDIVRFHRLKIDVFRGELQGRNIRGFSWLVFDGHPFPSEEPRSSSLSFTLTDTDKQTVHELKQWAATQPELKLPRSLIAEIEPSNDYTNIYGQIVCVMNEDNRFSIISIWDGSSPKCRSNPPLKGVSYDDVECLPDDIMVTAHTKALDVVLYDEHADQNLKPGDFVLLTNVHAKACSPRNGQIGNDHNQSLESKPYIELIIHSGRQHGRGVKILPNTDPHVQEIKDRIQNLQPTDPAQPPCVEMFTTNLTRRPISVPHVQAREIIPNQTFKEPNEISVKSTGEYAEKQDITSDPPHVAPPHVPPPHVAPPHVAPPHVAPPYVASVPHGEAQASASYHASEEQTGGEASPSQCSVDPYKSRSTASSKKVDFSEMHSGHAVSGVSESVLISGKPASAAQRSKVSTCCTISKFADVPFTRIAEIRRFSIVPYKFHCRVQVLFHLPEETGKYVKLGCQICRKIFHASELSEKHVGSSDEKCEGSVSSADGYLTAEEANIEKADSSPTEYTTAPEYNEITCNQYVPKQRGNGAQVEKDNSDTNEKSPYLAVRLEGCLKDGFPHKDSDLVESSQVELRTNEDGMMLKHLTGVVHNPEQRKHQKSASKSDVMLDKSNIERVETSQPEAASSENEDRVESSQLEPRITRSRMMLKHLTGVVHNPEQRKQQKSASKAEVLSDKSNIERVESSQPESESSEHEDIILKHLINKLDNVVERGQHVSSFSKSVVLLNENNDGEIVGCVNESNEGTDCSHDIEKTLQNPLHSSGGASLANTASRQPFCKTRDDKIPDFQSITVSSSDEELAPSQGIYFFCPDCNSPLRWTYLFSLCLDDGSSLLHCLLFGKDAENFFFDILPEDVHADDSLKQTLEDRFRFMIGETERHGSLEGKVRSVQSRPWMDCCIASYKDNGGNVCYSIFGTQFLPITME